MKISRFSQLFLDLLFPIQCLGCQRLGQWLCAGCLSTVESGVNQLDLDLESLYLDRVIVVASYDNSLLRYALHCFKYKFVKDIGGVLVGLVKLQHINCLKSYTFVPVPVHKKRKRYREFNQAQVLAGELAKKYKVKTDDKILQRIVMSAPQMSLGRAERLMNIKNVFQVSGSVKGKNIVLIDDVITTGATLNEAARVLKESGAKKVIGLVIAHGS